MHWLPLKSIADYNTAIHDNAICIVFKHSTRCHISITAKSRYERQDIIDYPTYLLDLLQHRELSDYIATTTGITHESPQLILFKDGKAIYHASHYNIDSESIISAL